MAAQVRDHLVIPLPLRPARPCREWMRSRSAAELTVRAPLGCAGALAGAWWSDRQESASQHSDRLARCSPPTARTVLYDVGPNDPLKPLA